METGPAKKEDRPNFPNIAQPRSALERSPVITLKTEHREFLTTLLVAYQRKLRYSLDKREIKYKIAILQKLTSDGIVDSLEISKELAKSANFSVGLFKTACGKIDACNDTGTDVDNVLQVDQKNNPEQKITTKQLEFKGNKQQLVVKVLQLRERLDKLTEIKSTTTEEAALAVNKIQINECLYRIAILKKLVEDDKVDSVSLAGELAIDPNFSPKTFNQIFTEEEKFVKAIEQLN